MAALIDEYKQAIRDVLDGRAKPAPRPSELPWTEDKAATMWAAAAAELIAEANSGGGSSGGGVLVVNDTDGTLDKTFKEINDAFTNGALPVVIYNGMIWYPSALPVLSDLYLSFKAINLTTHNDGYYIYAREYIAESETSYPVFDA